MTATTLASWRRAAFHFRSGMAIKLLGWALDIAPVEERGRLAKAVRWYLEGLKP